MASEPCKNHDQCKSYAILGGLCKQCWNDANPSRMMKSHLDYLRLKDEEGE